MSNLQQRLIVGAISFILLFFFIYFAPYPYFKPLFALGLAAIVAMGLWEYYRLAQAKAYKPLVNTGLATAILYIFACFFAIQNGSLWPQLVLYAGFFFSFLYFFKKENQPLANLAITLFGVAYVALPLSCALSIIFFFPDASPHDGRWWLLYIIGVSKMTDMGAFFVGKKLGRHQLAAQISPKKTVEGAIGGLVTAVISSALIPPLASWIDSPFALQVTLWQTLILGCLIGILSQIGDLGESLLKRDAGIKDSNQLPGLGGVLDMIDSLVFTLPLGYFFLYTHFLGEQRI